jgi:hypothetical protein
MTSGSCDSPLDKYTCDIAINISYYEMNQVFIMYKFKVKEPDSKAYYYLASCGSDFFYGAHKDVSDNGYARKTIQEAKQIKKCSHLNWPGEFADQW